MKSEIDDIKNDHSSIQNAVPKSKNKEVLQNIFSILERFSTLLVSTIPSIQTMFENKSRLRTLFYLAEMIIHSKGRLKVTCFFRFFDVLSFRHQFAQIFGFTHTPTFNLAMILNGFSLILYINLTYTYANLATNLSF